MMSRSEYVCAPRAPARLALRAALSTSVAKRSIVLRQAAACRPSSLAALRGCVAGAPAAPAARRCAASACCLGAPAAGVGDVLGIGAAVGAQDLAHALARDAEAQRDLVEAPALLAQRLHLAHALQRARGTSAQSSQPGGVERAPGSGAGVECSASAAARAWLRAT